MLKPRFGKHRDATSVARAGLISIAGALAAGCTVAVRPALPPPVYVEPPAVAVTAPEPAYEVQATEAPPPLPVYEQPPCPVVGFLWTPGYWGYAPAGYYWVPGTWVAPPRVGVLWTPGYWGFVGGAYAWHGGYWGPHVGFYGGVNYGHGYGGSGYAGGRWVGDSFAYNSAVTRVNVTVIHNTYNETVVNNVTVNRVSFNGGAGGVMATPTQQERVWARETHVEPTPVQQQHVQEAGRNPGMFARSNGGRPAIAATAHPATFTGPGVVGANLGAHSPGTMPPTAAHPAGSAVPGQPSAHSPGTVPPTAAHPPGSAVPGQPSAHVPTAAGKPPVAANTSEPKPPKAPKPPAVHKDKPEAEKG